MTTSTDVLPVRSGAAGGLAGLGLAGWLGTMSPHTARAYAGDLRQFTAWLAGCGIDPAAVTPGVTTAWLADLAAAGQSVATRRRKLAAVLSFYRYAAAEGVTVTPPKPHQVPRLHRDDADTGALDNQQARRLWEATADRPRTRALVGRRPAVLRPADRRSPHPAGGRFGHPAGCHRAARCREGGKPRTAVLPAPAVVAIRDWLSRRGSAIRQRRSSEGGDDRVARRLRGRRGNGPSVHACLGPW